MCNLDNSVIHVYRILSIRDSSIENKEEELKNMVQHNTLGYVYEDLQNLKMIVMRILIELQIVKKGKNENMMSHPLSVLV